MYRANFRENLIKQNSHGVEIRPPVQAAQKQNVSRLSFLSHRPKKCGVYAVVNYVRTRHTEFRRDPFSILIALGLA